MSFVLSTWKVGRRLYKDKNPGWNFPEKFVTIFELRRSKNIQEIKTSLIFVGNCRVDDGDDAVDRSCAEVLMTTMMMMLLIDWVW